METVVTTSLGRLRGEVVDGVVRFQGVPYAAPPSGARRMRPPQPVEPWEGVRDATRPGPAPPQVLPPEAAGVEWDAGSAGEDCLTLNLWTPDPGTTGLPVMVWVQGGAFEVGSTSAYDGHHFARDGVVCVVINWRVGADGFLHLGEGDCANLGLLDQVAALAWVREHIGAFGGDPDRVTVFGESAGAMSIGTLLGMPAAAGLFRRAVCQSGAAHHVLPRDVAARVGRRLAERLGVAPTREAVAAVPVERLLAAQAGLKEDLLAHPDPDDWGAEVVASVMPWHPVVDGDTLPAPPLEAVAAGSAADVDLVVGTNVDDWRLFLAITGELATITEEQLAGEVAVHGYRSVAAYGLEPAAALAAYRAHGAGDTPGDLLAAVQTDWWTRIPALRLADAHVTAARSARTWMYEFAWAAPGLGAVHALDVPFVFDTLGSDARLFGPLIGATAPQSLADEVHGAWVRFGRDGDPGWPAYDLSRRATRRLGTPSRVVEDPRAWERELWQGLR
jgi:carboxylesterase type B